MIFQVFMDDDPSHPYSCEADFIPAEGVEMDIHLSKHKGRYVVDSVQTVYEMTQEHDIGAAKLEAHVRLYLKARG